MADKDRPLPQGRVVFLMTDIVGSTRLWEHEPDAMSRALGLHDRIIERTVESFSGRILRQHGEGDSSLSVFTDDADALSCAVHLQRTLQRTYWDTVEPLRVRVVVHAGIPENREGSYFGAVLNEAGRLRAMAHGEQVLVSESVRLDANMPENATAVDLGLHKVRDVARAVHVYQLEHPHLRTGFPPLRSARWAPVKRKRSGTLVVVSLALVIVLATLVALAAVSTEDATPQSMKERRVGTALGTDAPQITSDGTRAVVDPSSAPTARGTFTLRAVDDAGRPVDGVEFEVSGPLSRRLVTGRDGQARVDGPPGSYSFEVRAGCYGTVHVLDPQSGDFGIARSTAGSANVRVDRRQRYMPSPPITSDGEWAVGERVEIGFRVIDSCTRAAAPNGELTRYDFIPGPAIRLLEDAPRSADPTGEATLAFSCVRAGSASLFVEDGFGVDRPFDLLASVSPSCAP
jgi:class 3 adenylate cyclase